MRYPRKLKRRALFLLAGLLAAGTAAAQAWPARPVRLIDAGPAAGGADVVARAIGNRLAESTGQQFIIDNRAGANGQIAAESVANAAPDGYTLLLGTTSALAINPAIGQVGYDPVRSFAPVTMVATAPLMLVVNPQLPVKAVNDLVRLARERPGKIAYASNGPGSLSHLTTELFKLQAGIDLMHVPYKGGAPAVNDTVANQTSLIITAFPTVLQQVRTGRLRAVAVTSEKRVPALPDVPSLAESGLPGFDAVQWYALFAPAGTPAAVIDRLQGAVRTAVAAPDVQQVFAREGVDAVANTPEQLRQFLAVDYARWARVAKAIQLKRE